MPDSAGQPADERERRMRVLKVLDDVYESGSHDFQTPLGRAKLADLVVVACRAGVHGQPEEELREKLAAAMAESDRAKPYEPGVVTRYTRLADAALAVLRGREEERERS